ncbi:ABC protein [Mycena kentingensis (nom. inval.)]|nr:ABC protein [Mycena kentingensis (nom. inval.)]
MILERAFCSWDPPPGTRLYHLISSNEPPLDSELLLISDALSALDAATQATSDAFPSRRAELRGVLSPLRRMPPELLADIFVMTMPPLESADNRYAGFSFTSTPWALTHVCARWRMVATQTRRLWSQVIITFLEDSKTDYPPELLELHLQHGRGFFVEFEASDERSFEPQLRVFELIARHAERWVRLFIGLSTTLLPAFNALRGRLQSLRTARLEWIGSRSSSPEAPLSIRCLEDAPALSEVHILNEYDYVPTPLNPEHLTWLSLDAPWDVHAELLRRAPNLETVHIHVDFDVSWPPAPDQAENTILLKQLHRLYASDANVFDYLRAPAVEHLALRTEGDELHFPPAILRLLERSGSQPSAINSICIAGNPTTSGVAEFLKQFPALEGLRLVFDTEDNESNPDWLEIEDIFELLTTSPLARALKSLSFVIEGEIELNTHLFVAMINARVQDGLRRVDLVTECALSQANGRDTILRVLKDHGLQHTFVDGSENFNYLITAVYGDEWLFYD